MDCENARRTVLDKWEDVPAPVREHLAHCSACAAYIREASLLRLGFQALADEPVPEASWGFTERVLRRLDESARQAILAQEFFEAVGRRVVYAAGLLAFLLLLVLALPSSGPLRGPTTAELYMAQSEVSAVGSNPVFGDEPVEASGVLPRAPANGGGEKKQ